MMKIYERILSAIGIVLIVTSTTSALKSVGKVIIDTDAGGDDAVAILLALSAQDKLIVEGYEVVAITCIYGNTEVTNVEQNVLKILTIANRSDIPVYSGVSRPLLKNFTKDNYFGEDGLGDIDFDEKIIGDIDRTNHASIALVELARKHAGNISIMALGPLTNVALAMTLDPSFENNIVRIWIMGSSVQGLGNIAPNVEFNFSQDPPSNFIVLNGTRGLPAILLPWETCKSLKISTEWRKYVLGASNSRVMKFLNAIERDHLSNLVWEVADQLLSALTFWPNLITRSILTNVTPVYDGAAQGSILVDYANKTGKAKNTIIVQSVNVEAFKLILLKLLR